jgi:hypothetical protein
MSQDLWYVTYRIELLRREAAANRLASGADTSRHDHGRHVLFDSLVARRRQAAVRIGVVMLTAALASAAAGPVLAERSDGSASRPNRASPTPTIVPSASPTMTATPAPSASLTASPTATPTPTISPEPSPSQSGHPVAYTDSYWAQLAYFPQGWANNYCEVEVALAGGGGICETIIIPIYLYPDGTWGACAWKVEPAADTGWSIVEERCPGDFEGF